MKKSLSILKDKKKNIGFPNFQIACKLPNKLL